jgi:ABC-type ATPase with predicted acetyltransferase domain
MRMNLAGKGLAPGFVWEENGQIIGNVSLIQSDLSGRFLIANVAVLPEYRRKGIGRMLMQETIDYVQGHQGREILLQVERDNQAAIQLYNNIGFSNIGTIRRWETSTSRLRNLPPAVSDDTFEIRSLRNQDSAAAYHLDRAVTNPNFHWPNPITPNHYKRGLWQWLTGFLNGRKVETWTIAIPTGKQDKKQLVGLANINTEWGRPHNIELRVLPGWQGQLERPLISQLIRRLRYLKRTTIVFDHQSEDEVVNNLLPQANFQIRRYLTFMQLPLRG